MPRLHTVEELKDVLAHSIKDVFDNDKHLLDVNAHEQAITHQIAHYLKVRLAGNGWSVDAEYNRMGRKPKAVSLPNEDPADERKSLVKPDIIVHEPGEGGHNLLAVEVKNGGSLEEQNRDYMKLEAYVEELHYDCGLFIDLKPLGLSPTFDAIKAAIEP